jgi:DNA-binding XRE family transcriptional regulator
MGKKFSELRNKMTPESQARSRALANKYREEMALDELRTARDLTQETLAELLGVNQAAISKLERRADWYVSTLNSMIRAMGGSLEIIAKFPDGGVVRIKTFRQLRRKAKAA